MLYIIYYVVGNNNVGDTLQYLQQQLSFNTPVTALLATVGIAVKSFISKEF